MSDDVIELKALEDFVRIIETSAPKNLRYILVAAAQDGEQFQSAIMTNVPRPAALAILKETVKSMDEKAVRVSTFPKE